MLRLLLVATILITACGREPSRLLRQGQLPIYDFPLYLTEGVAGKLWRIERDRSKTLVAEGLTDPRGIATDRFHNVYVAEYGADRLLKFPAGSSAYEVVRDGLESPSIVAVDSFGEVYVGQDAAMNIIRASDGKVFGTYSTSATALTFGVNDQPIVGLYGQDQVLWGWQEQGSKAASVAMPVNASIDGTGRVYVALGDPLAGQVFRFHQREPSGQQLVAEGLVGPSSIAVDLVGNIFLVEQGAQRIVLVTFDGTLYSWVSELQDPQAVAFTQY